MSLIIERIIVLYTEKATITPGPVSHKAIKEEAASSLKADETSGSGA